MTRRTDYLNDPQAPAATRIVPGGAALVVDGAGRILLQRRSDNGNWSLPGGIMEIGETLGAATVREVREETGIEVELTGILGVYSDPGHVIAYSSGDVSNGDASSGDVRQEFVVVFTARSTGGKLAVSDESTEVAFVPLAEVARLPMHPSVRLRIGHWAEGRKVPYIG